MFGQAMSPRLFLLSVLVIVGISAGDLPAEQPRPTPADRQESQQGNAPLFLVERDDEFGFIDAEGKLVIGWREVQEQEDFHDGMAAFLVDGKWGHINTNGQTVIEPRFEEAKHFSEGLAPVRLDGKTGFIDKQGRFVIQPRLQHAWPFHEGLAHFSADGKFGFIDRQGKVAIPPHFDLVSPFSRGRAAVEKRGGSGYIDKDGNYVIKPNLALARSFDDYGALVMTKERKFRVVDLDGTTKLNVPYEICYEFFDGLAQIRVDGKWGYADLKGKVVIPPKFIAAGAFSDGRASVVLRRGGLLGFIDQSGKVVIPPKFNHVSRFRNGLARVISDEVVEGDSFACANERGDIEIVDEGSSRRTARRGYINRAGQYVWGPHEFVEEFGNPPRLNKSRFETLELKAGMKRAQVEKQVADFLGKRNKYSTGWSNLRGGTVQYRDGDWILEVVYKAGAPAPTVSTPDGGHRTYEPIDETVIRFEIKKQEPAK